MPRELLHPSRVFVFRRLPLVVVARQEAFGSPLRRLCRLPRHDFRFAEEGRSTRQRPNWRFETASVPVRLISQLMDQSSIFIFC